MNERISIFLGAVTAVIFACAGGAVSETEAYVARNLVKPLVEGWGVGGSLKGDVVYREDFSDAARVKRDWILGTGAALRDDGTGGKAIELTPCEGQFANAYQAPGAYVPVAPGSVTVLNWTARTPEGGNPPSMRIDYYDAEKRHLGSYQVASATDPTQPTLFHRNTLFVADRLPAGARYFRIFPNQSPLRADVKRCEIGEVIVTDVAGEASRLLATRQSSAEDRAKAAPGDVLVNVSADCGADFPILPDATILPGKTGDRLALRECRGQIARATAILWSKGGYEGVRVRFAPLTRGPMGIGGEIPAAALSAKVVKVHYQADGAPTLFVATGGGQVLVPELLLNDETLVRPDHSLRHNFVRFDRNGGEYVDINASGATRFGQAYAAKDLPIRDAATLQPFALERGKCKQLIFEVAVPAKAKSGTYRGRIAFDCDGREIAAIPLTLEVLPFTLPETAETFYSPENAYTMGLYYWGELQPEGSPLQISILRKSRAQMLAELRLMIHYGIDTPILIWGARTVYDDAEFRRHLEVAREAGLSGTLYLGMSDLIGNPTAPAELATLKERIVRAKRVAAEYGFGEVYFYGLDEARAERLLSQRTAWKAVREAGGKVIVSGYIGQFKMVGDLLDLCVYAGEPYTAHPEEWHGIGHRIWKYNYPQTGPEDPNVFRRNYGLYLWRCGFDGACTYCFCGSSNPWNDLGSWQRLKETKKAGCPYRAQAVGYLTLDGAVPTIEILGLADAIKDVRYMALFRRLLRERPNAQAEKWFNSLELKVADPETVRAETIDWILKLEN